MNRRRGFGLALGVALAAAPGRAADLPPPAAFEALGEESRQDLIVLGETRPILLRIRLMVGGKPFRAVWIEAVRAFFAKADRDGDGKISADESLASGLAGLVGKGSGTPVPFNSVDEMIEALRATSGPIEIRALGLADRRTDALFEHLDRDKDGTLARAELASMVGSLRRLDFDDDETISVEEVALGSNAADSAAPRAGRGQVSIPPLVELVAGESPLRVARLIVRKYDRGSDRGVGRLDSKLSPDEFAIDPARFAEADGNHDGKLDTEEVRKYLARAPRDVVLDVALAADPDAHPAAGARAGEKATGLNVRQLDAGVVEVDLGAIRLDVHIDDGQTVVENARKGLRARIVAADANQDGYVEESEIPPVNNQPAPLGGLFKTLDRNHDGKLYPSEADEYVDLQAIAARGRLTLSASDEGRALFGLLDLDRDRRLGAREVLNTAARVSACDRDNDGRVAPEEIPHHIQIILTRGDLSALVMPAAPGAIAASPGGAGLVNKGPGWFRKMDRNGDGDVSRREFLGSRDQFDTLDRDHDGLIAAEEAAAAKPVKGPGG